MTPRTEAGKRLLRDYFDAGEDSGPQVIAAILAIEDEACSVPRYAHDSAADLAALSADVRARHTPISAEGRWGGGLGRALGDEDGFVCKTCSRPWNGGCPDILAVERWGVKA